MLYYLIIFLQKFKKNNQVKTKLKDYDIPSSFRFQQKLLDLNDVKPIKNIFLKIQRMNEVQIKIDLPLNKTSQNF